MIYNGHAAVVRPPMLSSGLKAVSVPWPPPWDKPAATALMSGFVLQRLQPAELMMFWVDDQESAAYGLLGPDAAAL